MVYTPIILQRLGEVNEKAGAVFPAKFSPIA